MKKKSFKVMINHAKVEFRTAKKTTIFRTFGGLFARLNYNLIGNTH